MNEAVTGSGNNWQQYVNRLLATHFTQQGQQYIPIPDKVQGDGGLEGFSTNGHAFQSYADEASVSTADRACKQKRKVTRDLAKLADPKRQQFWCDLLQMVKLLRWSLVVPTVEDKTVLVHARKKGEELRAANLPFLAPDFQATVISANEAFPVAAKTLVRSGVSFIPDGYIAASEADLAAFATASRDQVTVLEKKLRRLPAMQQDDARRKAIKTLLGRYLDSENLLARLKEANPPLWEQILVQRQEHARNLETEKIFDTSTPPERVESARTRFRDAVSSLLNSKVSTTADTVAIGAISLWLLECPLDFPEVTGA